jgi:hypothetical protein
MTNRYAEDYTTRGAGSDRLYPPGIAKKIPGKRVPRMRTLRYGGTVYHVRSCVTDIRYDDSEEL